MRRYHPKHAFSQVNKGANTVKRRDYNLQGAHNRKPRINTASRRLFLRGSPGVGREHGLQRTVDAGVALISE